MKQIFNCDHPGIMASIFLILLFSVPSSVWSQDIPQPGVLITESDKKAIADLARDIPLILSNEGWDAYTNTFTNDYKNWSMIGDKVRERKEYLSLVKDWYDKGNRATESRLNSIGFIPVDSSCVLFLYALREEFNSTNDSSGNNSRDIRFVAIYRKIDGAWKNSFTAFMDMPKL
ncbi:hypothetical protein SAMN04490243_0765 [Robiginitalea myxolifaciens]|uniref:DUF4440 domain-containing protein n=1 Tax=Robiginitalea myxolifaciens TaxID=400055 RepID=A0A1I6FVP5_9FLAO|nr:hypothetical protein [Robiginitalea myxolifaciens]SFR34009.1 hypothetical protein SAMN04490243_0765 [Robiginitalea myxolifaciens]